MHASGLSGCETELLFREQRYIIMYRGSENVKRNASYATGTASWHLRVPTCTMFLAFPIQNVVPSVTVCHGLSPSVTVCHGPSPSVTVRHRLSP